MLTRICITSKNKAKYILDIFENQYVNSFFKMIFQENYLYLETGWSGGAKQMLRVWKGGIINHHMFYDEFWQSSSGGFKGVYLNEL